MNEVLIYATIWMILENIMPSERSQLKDQKLSKIDKDREREVA